ncbi:MAG: hypothetical protein ACRDVM_03515 [Acidimicrobiia bacterium]
MACRRAAEYELRGAQRRLERLEEEAHGMRWYVAMYEQGQAGLDVPEDLARAQLTFYEEESARAEERLRSLLQG